MEPAPRASSASGALPRLRTLTIYARSDSRYLLLRQARSVLQVRRFFGAPMAATGAKLNRLALQR
jgi:hypothetical protein